MKTSLPLVFAARYFRTQRRDTGNASTLLSVLGIAVGVMTLTVVLAVMNGFQLGFIESIVEISSYHLQARPRPATVQPPDAEVSARLVDIPGVIAVVPFVERQALIQGEFQRPHAASVRAVPPDLFARDPAQARMLKPLYGSFDLSDPHSIVVGSEVATGLGLRIGEPVSVDSYAAGAGGRPVPRRDVFRVAGVFQTGYLDFDSGLVFISLEAADALYGGGTPKPVKR